MTVRKNKKAPALALATPAPTDREKIWAAMRQEKTFTLERIAHLTGCKEHQVKDYARGLTASGHVRRPDDAKRFAKVEYTLARDTGVDAPRVRKDGTVLPASGRTRMWNVMPILKVFTVGELVNAASLPGAPVAFDAAHSYCKWLVRGGYLDGGAGVYHFIPARLTGAKAPQILRVRVLFDPNLGAVVYQSAAEGRDDE